MARKGSLITYERAFLGQAEREKYSQSTFSERKIMSTKTAFKRVALVAAAALAIGGISAVSAQAAASDTFTVKTSTSYTVTNVALATNVATITVASTNGINVGDSVVISGLTTTALNGTVIVTAVAPTTFTFSLTHANITSVADTGTVVDATPTPASTAASYSATVGTYVSTTLTFTGDTNNADNITSTGVGTLNVPSIVANTNTLATTSITPTSFTAFAANGQTAVPGSSATALDANAGVLAVTFSAYSAVAGTQTISVTGSGGTSTFTITWGAAPVISTQYSTSGLSSGINPVTQGTNATVVFADTAQSAVANRAATIVVAPFNSNDFALATETLTATISGPGTLGIATTAALAASTGRALTGSAGQYTVDVYGDGTSGVSTITITDGSTVLATKTVTFYGSPSKATVKQNLFVAEAGAQLGQLGNDKALTDTTVTANDGAAANHGTAGSGTAAFTASVVDANGNASAGATVKAVSSNTAVITTSAPVEETTDAPGTWQVAVSGAAGALSGQSATVTFEVYDTTTSAYDILATPITFTIGGAIASETLSTDSTSYNALAPVKLTVTAKDSAGNPAYDQDGALVSNLLSSVQLGGNLASPNELVNGVGSVSGIYAPSVAGNFTITATDAVSGNSEAVTSVTATSLGGSADAAGNAATDAANEATDAANAATDAANAAADAADAATSAAQDAGAKADAALAAVTALSAKITVLAAQIAKIVKKLKA